MAQIIVDISEKEFTVNNKRVFEDMEGNWVGSQSMNTAEVAAAQRHLLKVNNLLVSKQ